MFQTIGNMIKNSTNTYSHTNLLTNALIFKLTKNIQNSSQKHQQNIEKTTFYWTLINWPLCLLLWKFTCFRSFRWSCLRSLVLCWLVHILFYVPDVPMNRSCFIRNFWNDPSQNQVYVDDPEKMGYCDWTFGSGWFRWCCIW